jgi:hypothetical protein
MSTMESKSAYERARGRAMRKQKFTGFGYFWPGWVMAVWGVILVLSAWEIFFRTDLTEEDIQREMGKQ